MDWTEVAVTVSAEQIDAAGDIAQMVVPYGIYIEDYRNLEDEAWEIAHIDIIDEDLLKKDRSKGIIHIYIAPEENPMEAVAFLSERYNAAGISHEISTNACRNEDWENNWKQYFKPLPVGDKLLIQPLWEDETDAGDRKVLHLEPGLAFGTGGHYTTRLCLEAMEEYINDETTVLDIGCGSGILGLSALALGAKSALGVDIDELAVKTAIENGNTNGYTEPQFTVLQGDLTEKVHGEYDIVAANIVADVIIRFAGDVQKFMKPNGIFVTSGIIDDREDDVLNALAENGFKIISRRTDGGWVCFVAERA